MFAEDQSDVVEFLSRPEAYGERAASVEKVETHISVVFIVGERAYKLKRAVRFPYLDFTTADLRRRYCEAEVALNRRTAPQLYHGVVAVTRRADGGLCLGGDGTPVDWLVEMTRFDGGTLFECLADRDGLDRHLMEDTADVIAAFHAAAERTDRFGGREGIAAVVENNVLCFAEHADALDADKVERLTADSRCALEICGDLLDRRRMAGQVRRGHGDLHLRNICLFNGRPTLFDCIEFSERLTCVDVLYDLAFLLMDLDHHGQRTAANIVMNCYLDRGGDATGLAAMPVFLSVRAAIRAHVAASVAASIAASVAPGQADRGRAAAALDEAHGYLDMALGYLAPPPPRLVAVGGLSGSGKSRFGRDAAYAVGAAPGARIIRTDVLRKRLAGVDPLTRLPPEAYTPEMNARTYAALYEEVRVALATGHSVIADAVFARPGERAAIAEVAAAMGVPFNGLWLEAPAAVMAERVARRRRNPSDATAEVVRRQLDYDLGDLTWDKVDSAGKRENTINTGLRLLGL